MLSQNQQADQFRNWQALCREGLYFMTAVAVLESRWTQTNTKRRGPHIHYYGSKRVVQDAIPEVWKLFDGAGRE